MYLQMSLSAELELKTAISWNIYDNTYKIRISCSVLSPYEIPFLHLPYPFKL